MAQKDKIKEELIEEIKLLQKRIAELETLDSERKQQQDIRRLATVVRDSNDAIIIQDLDGRITAWNRGAEQMYGYKEKETLGMNIERLTPSGKVAEQKEFTRRLIAGKEVASFETQRVTKDGRIFDVWLTVTKLVGDTGKPVGIASTERDITERKKVEEVLRGSEKYLKEAQRLGRMGSWKYIPATGETEWSGEMFWIYGIDPKGGVPPFNMLAEMVHREDRQKWGEVLKEARRTGSFSDLEYRIIRPNGQCRWILACESTQPESKETPLVFYGTVMDITERKKAEEALRESEERYRIQFDQTIDALFLADTETGIILECNRAATELIGREKSEMVGQHQRILHPSEELDGNFSKSFKQHITGEALVETKVIKKSGEIRDVAIKASTFDLKGKNVILAVFRDITERKKAEEKLIQALKEEVMSREIMAGMLDDNKQTRKALEKSLEILKETQDQLINAEKMEAIGRMATGIAHEVKNPLGIILQGINYFEGEIPREQKDNREMLDMMKSSVKRADKIIRALLDFSRAEELKMEQQGVNPIIESSIDLVGHRLKLNNIELVRDLRKDLPQALMDKGKIEQVFVNLFNNAADAMPQGGKLYVRSYLSGEKKIIVEIEDTGMGIDEDIMNKIFDPFFTTKHRTEGTGLGLSVAKSIIDTHKGLIEVESEKGKGTKFTIVFKIPERGKG